MNGFFILINLQSKPTRKDFTADFRVFAVERDLLPLPTRATGRRMEEWRNFVFAFQTDAENDVGEEEEECRPHNVISISMGH